MSSFFSICIPAYKNAGYLRNLLDSIDKQSFRDFEVIVSDDSPGDEVEILCKEYNEKFKLLYFKNIPAKGSPLNWNTAIEKASGLWIKLMHDDDWFASSESLKDYSIALVTEPKIDFIFSYYADYENGHLKKTNRLSKLNAFFLSKSPLYLFRKNYVGNPSNVLIRNNSHEWYDTNLKWVVDFEFYIRFLKNHKFYCIPKILVNVGNNEEQITKQVFRNIKVEIPENIYMLNKLGAKTLSNIIVYDYYWRLFRNLKIRSKKEVTEVSLENKLPQQLIKLMEFQFRFSLKMLNIGIFSKLLMLISYVRFRLFE